LLSPVVEPKLVLESIIKIPPNLGPGIPNSSVSIRTLQDILGQGIKDMHSSLLSLDLPEETGLELWSQDSAVEFIMDLFNRGFR
jgi:hypothetical protein